MMEKEKKSKLVAEIKKILDENKAVLGTNVSLKEIKKNNLKKVYLSSNIPQDIKNDIFHFSKLAGTEVIDTVINNEEMGLICKKSFLISVIGEKK